jgi:hypothetical protein
VALNPKRTNAVRSTLCDTQTALLNTGYLRIYDGAQPATADTAVGAQVLLVTLRFGATAFAASVNGTATANAITSGTAAATSTASWFRLLKSDGTTVVCDGSVGTSSADLVLNTVSIVSGSTVSASAFTITQT